VEMKSTNPLLSKSIIAAPHGIPPFSTSA